MSGKLTLTKAAPDGKLVPVNPNIEVPQPGRDMLSKIPGGLKAWDGLIKATWEVCTVHGASVVVNPAKLQDFKDAPHDIQEEVRGLVAHHDEHYKCLLSAVPEPSDGGPRDDDGGVTLVDPRTAGSNATLGEDPAESMDGAAPAGSSMDGEDGEAPAAPGDGKEHALKTWPNMAALREEATISVSALSAKKGVTVVRPADMSVVLFSELDVVLPVGTTLGSYGSGKHVTRDEALTRAVPWELNAGDRSMVQLAAMTTDKKGGPKYTTGPLYTIIRSVLAKGNQRINITGYGQVKTSGQAWIVCLVGVVSSISLHSCVDVLGSGTPKCEHERRSLA